MTVPGVLDDQALRRYRELLDAEDAAFDELEHAYEEARADAAFQTELADLLKDYAGRPTPLTFCKRLTEQLGGAKIYLKREDLLHTGAHKINNALG